MKYKLVDFIPGEPREVQTGHVNYALGQLRNVTILLF